MTSISPALIGRADELALGRQAVLDAVATVRHVVYVGARVPAKRRSSTRWPTPRRRTGHWFCARAARRPRPNSPFAGLSQLLRPALADAVDLPVTPPAGARPRPAHWRTGPPDRGASVAMAVLALLELLSRDQPLVLVIDDIQWIDRATLDVLAFVGRRAVNLPMAVLAATRELNVILVPGATVTEIGPLDPDRRPGGARRAQSGARSRRAADDPASGRRESAGTGRATTRARAHCRGGQPRRRASGDDPHPGVVRQPARPAPARTRAPCWCSPPVLNPASSPKSRPPLARWVSTSASSIARRNSTSCASTVRPCDSPIRWWRRSSSRAHRPAGCVRRTTCSPAP